MSQWNSTAVTFTTENYSFFNENVTNYETPINVTDFNYGKRPETYIVPMLFALIFIVGVLGNGTLLLIFVRHRNMRNVPNTYILSLAIGDLLVIVTTVPFTAISYVHESWPFGEFVCKVIETAKDISIGVSIYTLTALSADRFFAIVAPMRKLHPSGRGSRLTIFVVIFIWLLSILFALPAAVATSVISKVYGKASFDICYPFPDKWKHFGYPKIIVLGKFIVYYVIPLFIIAVFYALMARHLLISTQNMPGEPRGQQRQVKARKKVAKMVLVFVIVFAICFFPQHVFMIWFYYNPNSDQDYGFFWHVFRIVGFCLTFINSCINPTALYCVSGTFRKHYNRYLFCGKGSGTSTESSRGGSRRRSLSGGRRGVHGDRMGLTGTAGIGIGIAGSSRRQTGSRSSWETTTLAHIATSTGKRPNNPVEIDSSLEIRTLPQPLLNGKPPVDALQGVL